MNNYCRLCADPKADDELNIKISDPALQIHEKLIACCQWDNYHHDANLPTAICCSCYEKLEKSWLFSESVAFAQTKLSQIFHEIELAPVKCELDLDDNGFHAYDSEPEPEQEPESKEIFVDPIAPSEEIVREKKEKKPSTKIVVKSIETSNEAEQEQKPVVVKATRARLDAIKLYECIKCSLSFRSPYYLRMHSKIHVNEGPHGCLTCGKEFVLASKLHGHLRKIHGKDLKLDRSKFQYECYQCHRKYRLKWTLQKHLLLHSKTHANEEPEHGCLTCGKKFASGFQLRGHLTRIHGKDVHRSKFQYECYQCHQKFRLKLTLQRHLLVHNPLEASRQFTCESCGIGYRQQVGLTKHLLTAHSEARPWKCDICGMGFKLKRILNEHLKTHAAIEFKCTQCSKMFRRKKGLELHMEYHTGTIVKPFACDLCDKTFRLNCNLVEHRRIHTGEKPYICEHCPFTFRTMSSFYSHLRKNHGISKSAQKLKEWGRATPMSKNL